jgi:hypothetical protein
VKLSRTSRIFLAAISKTRLVYSTTSLARTRASVPIEMPSGWSATLPLSIMEGLPVNRPESQRYGYSRTMNANVRGRLSGDSKKAAAPRKTQVSGPQFGLRI